MVTVIFQAAATCLRNLMVHTPPCRPQACSGFLVYADEQEGGERDGDIQDLQPGRFLR